MIAADHDRRLQLAARHHLVEGEAQPMAVAEPDPADARRQALELDARSRHVEPVVQVRVVRHQLLHLGVGAVDVLRIARQRRPAERPDAAAEQRADIGRHEAREIEGIGDALSLRHLADVVAVVEGRHAAPCGTSSMARTCSAIDCLAARSTPFGIARAPRFPFGERPALRQIAVERIVRRGLVGDDVGPDAAPHQLREDVGGVAEQADRDRLLVATAALDHGQRLVEVVRLRVEIAGAQPHLDAARLAFDREHRGARHGGGERLRAAHAAEAGGEDPLPARLPP